MSVQQSYNSWASQYDTNLNKTRDLEALALREVLSGISFSNCLEIGCGTGKNTEWLIQRAQHITAVDLSEEMLAKAKTKITSGKVEFKKADITKPWAFGTGFDLVTFSLVLEHIENLEPIFKEAAAALQPGGHVYIGEFHPFKQYTGSKARFDTGEGVHILECYNHNISDFIQAAKKHGLTLADVNEYFDDNNRSEIPRVVVIILKKG